MTAVVVNERVTPTHSAADLKNKITPPDIVSIEGKDLKVIAGMHSDEQFFNRPEVQKRDPAKDEGPQHRRMSRSTCAGSSKAAGPYTVRVKSVKGGVAEAASQ